MSSGYRDTEAAWRGLADIDPHNQSDDHEPPDDGRPVQRYRSIWLSDTHLGMPETRVDLLHDFLKHTESDYLYLVGDIIDLWKLRNGWYWPAVNNSILRRITRKAKFGTRVIYVPGNHDDLLREYLGMSFGDVTLRGHAIHVAADGKSYLVLHGDEFDAIVTNNRLLSLLGSEAYAISLKLNRWFNACRRLLGYPYWSLSAVLKRRVKNAMTYISNYEEAVVSEARRRGVDGVICGHIHNAAIMEIDGITYCNDGDWVESCTALVEHHDGRLELLDWTQCQAPAELAVTHPSETGTAHADRDHLGRLVPTG